MLDEKADDGWRKSLASATDEDLIALVRPEDRSEVAFEPSVRGLAVRTLPITAALTLSEKRAFSRLGELWARRGRARRWRVVGIMPPRGGGVGFPWRWHTDDMWCAARQSRTGPLRFAGTCGSERGRASPLRLARCMERLNVWYAWLIWRQVRLWRALHEGVTASSLALARRRPEDTTAWVNLHRHLPLQRQVAEQAGGEASAQPLVSVLIVHHERPRLLTQAVHSVIAQEYRRVEIVVVDNGSEGERTHHQLDTLEEELSQHSGRMFRIRKLPLGAGAGRVSCASGLETPG
jgi:hypothetical protein